jgi:hypothetical protein
MSGKVRQGKYRFQMIEEQKLQLWATPLESIFQKWTRQLDVGNLKSWEFVVAYLLIFVFLNRPKEKWRLNPLFSMTEGRQVLITSVQEEFGALLSEGQLQRWADCLSWLDGKMMSLRGVPEKVLMSLRGWRESRYQLELMHTIPSAQELLDMQRHGRRCVSALIRANEITGPVETGRDVWSFCLHDLLHASHFFGNPEWICAQRFLSDFFLRAWKESSLQTYLLADPEFASDYEYIAADMNAHPVYILCSFYAKFLEQFKRRSGYSSAQILPAQEEIRWQEIWRKFLDDMILDSDLKSTLGELATTRDSTDTYKKMEHNLRSVDFPHATV